MEIFPGYGVNLTFETAGYCAKASASPVIVLPDNASSAAAVLVASASGAGRAKTTLLIASEEVDGAVEKTVDYRPPSQ